MQVFLSLLLCISMLAWPTKIYAEGTSLESSRSYVVMELQSGQVLKEHNMNDAIPPASITKIMTMLLINEAVASGKIHWDDNVTVSEHAAGMGGSQVFMEEGEQQTVRDLLKCIAISSANDAAVTMAEHIGGSEPQFVDLMNKKAQELGMKDTTFKNACGLHVDGHVSSAYDVALMSRELMIKYPEMTKTLTTWMDSIIHRTRKGESEFGLSNTNKMLKWYSGITGLKTGYTPEAKHCVSATATRNGMSLVAVVLGGSDSKTRFREAGRLLDYGFANFTVKQGPQVGDIVGEATVEKGKSDTVNATVENSMTFVVAKGAVSDDPQYEIIFDESIVAPIYKGQKIGTLKYVVSDEETAEENLVAMEDVEKRGFKIFSKFKNMFKKDK
ncbi:D-alanyl-D-alanine carboxypeptidase [Candidatus Epulonipiscium fishelsonii]|uniref:D-alanyl-D-alanine carboxypeptidase n=1 Tax=Candidatus Epulonipiscium fishelsonii TaxID=77094 RepID=A0ACC8XI93_9FIRM|nr:D-alanyl-D-alanine carboxypeptidase [Epulopiscium sp. SCG-D08WGA-EpuloA1]OON92833.1 MAG: D-alanyl-D-alanine carboxypeptidase [Epulopiscium sp. AS2M-Bin002]